MRRFVLLLVLGLAGIGAAAPSAGRAPAIVAPNVAVGGVFVGGLTSEQARARLRWAYSRPLRLVAGTQRFEVQRSRLGFVVDVDDAVSRALRVRSGARLHAEIAVDRGRVRSFVKSLDRRFSYPAKDAHAYLSGLAPAIAPSRPGAAVSTQLMEQRLVAGLQSATARLLRVSFHTVAPAVTASSFGPIVVIHRGSNRLYFYERTTLVRTFKVATGRAQYPTPLGSWSVVDKQRDPWWRPPNSDWAKGLKPIPPGPGNPLGTRWMGLSAPGVGMHGTPDAASVGYSASHGCIRMYVPDAEWLFDHVSIGTPVFIVAA